MVQRVVVEYVDDMFLCLIYRLLTSSIWASVIELKRDGTEMEVARTDAQMRHGPCSSTCPVVYSPAVGLLCL